MNRRTLWIVLLSLAIVWLVSCQTMRPRTPALTYDPDGLDAAQTARPRVGSIVEEAHFGYWHAKQRQNQFVETNHIPFCANRAFGWSLKLKHPVAADAKVTERFTLPAPPATWGAAEGSDRLSNDRRSVTTEREVTGDGRWIGFVVWRLSDGDAPGPHVTEVEIDGELAARFVFWVDPNDECPAELDDGPKKKKRPGKLAAAESELTVLANR
ncbi:MAG TPA: hypothetical protein PKW95_19905 [bacterium]|nr:hypothetical protein [bacterium]